MEKPVPVTPDFDADESLLAGISIDVLIDALNAAMIFQDETEQAKTIVLIKALEAAKIFS